MARPNKLIGAQQKPRNPDVPLKALPIRDFAKAFGVSQVTVWRGLRDGRLKAVRVGRNRLVLLDSVQPA